MESFKSSFTLDSVRLGIRKYFPFLVDFMEEEVKRSYINILVKAHGIMPSTL